MANKLENLRKTIDNIDDSILELLVKRKMLSVQAGKIKRMTGKKINDNAREPQIILRLRNLANQKGIDEKFTAGLFRVILNQSKKEQSILLAKK